METGFLHRQWTCEKICPYRNMIVSSIIKITDCSFPICAGIALLNDLSGVLWKHDDKILIGNYLWQLEC